MIAEAVSEEAPVAPLFAAMATEIHYTAAQIGQASESRRLDPPLLMGLDEVRCPSLPDSPSIRMDNLER
jgi:hypothetical protein